MIKNYFKTAWRNLLINKTSSFINISGLAVGMAVAVLIGLWLWNEFSFNKSFNNYKTIAQVFQNQNFNGEINTDATVPMPLGYELRTKYGSNFKRVVLASFMWNHIIGYGDKNLLKRGSYMEPDGAELFSLHMLQGKRSALNEPSVIILSESVAKAIFGNADPMNKILKLDNKINVKVGGVYEDLPINTSLNDLSFILPWDLYAKADESLKEARTNWGYNSFQIYVQITDNANMNVVSAKIKNAKLDHTDNNGDTKYNTAIFLQPMSNWRLYSEFKNGVNVGGRIQYAWMHGIIGVFVLLLACINFMNLSTARSEKRAKEVGVRKAIGSSRSQLIRQFFTESLLVTIFAFCLALFLIQLSLPFFNKISERTMSIPWNNIFFWLAGIGFSIVTGLIAGSYPALYLSSFKPVKVLKGTLQAGRFANFPRKVLVVLQFSVSVILIVSTIVVSRQVHFARNRPVGYSRDGLIVMEMFSPNIHNHFNAFKNDLINTGAVKETAESGSTTTGVYNNNGDFHWKGKDPNMADMFATIGISNSYGKTVGWQFVSGRDFSSSFATDSAGLVLNEAAVKYMHLINPVGESIRWGKKYYKVIGVIKDMIMESPYEPSRQTVFYIDKNDGDFLNIRINPQSSAANSLSKIATVFKKYEPSVPFDYKFADEEYAKKFAIEERVGRLATFFSSLAIFISCLGLFGMASFMAEQRIKEIGVRKVLGASVFNLWKLLLKDFVGLVIISLLIATPLAYLFMYKWLQGYQYHAALSWWIFAAAGAGALLITLLTVSFQSVKAALANPVTSLRSE